MVGCCKLLLYGNDLVMSMRFTFGDDWDDVLCKSLFWSLAMMLFLWNRGPWIFVYSYTRIACDRKTLFPVVANTRTKSIQKQIKSIDVDKVGSNKKALTAASYPACFEIRWRNEEVINSTRNMINSLIISYFINVDTFYLLLNWFSTCVSDDQRYLSRSRLYACINTRKFKGVDSKEITSLPDIKKMIYVALHFDHRRK